MQKRAPVGWSHRHLFPSCLGMPNDHARTLTLAPKTSTPGHAKRPRRHIQTRTPDMPNGNAGTHNGDASTHEAGLRFQRASMPRRLDSGKPLYRRYITLIPWEYPTERWIPIQANKMPAFPPSQAGICTQPALTLHLLQLPLPSHSRRAGTAWAACSVQLGQRYRRHGSSGLAALPCEGEALHPRDY